MGEYEFGPEQHDVDITEQFPNMSTESEIDRLNRGEAIPQKVFEGETKVDRWLFRMAVKTDVLGGKSARRSDIKESVSKPLPNPDEYIPGEDPGLDRVIAFIRDLDL